MFMILEVPMFNRIDSQGEDYVFPMSSETEVLVTTVPRESDISMYGLTSMSSANFFLRLGSHDLSLVILP